MACFLGQMWTGFVQCPTNNASGHRSNFGRGQAKFVQHRSAESSWPNLEHKPEFGRGARRASVRQISGNLAFSVGLDKAGGATTACSFKRAYNMFSSGGGVGQKPHHYTMLRLDLGGIDNELCGKKGPFYHCFGHSPGPAYNNLRLSRGLPYNDLGPSSLSTMADGVVYKVVRCFRKSPDLEEKRRCRNEKDEQSPEESGGTRSSDSHGPPSPMILQAMGSPHRP